MHNLRNNEKRAICGICAAGCWVIVTYDGEGRIERVRADETSVHGAICRVGESSPEIVYSDKRITRPLIRSGPRGTYDFETTSWDHAYDVIVDRLRRIREESGPEATAVYTGSGSFELAFCDVFQPEGVRVSSAASVLFPFGSPNTLGVGALCYVAFAMIAPHVTMGGMFVDMFSDIEHAELIVIWGKNPASHCPPHDFMRIQEAHRRGAKIVVIDPRKTVMAKFPHARWIPVRPGTDGALALAMCSVLIDEELYDEEFVKNWTVGFEEFVQYAQHYRPEVVERITGIEAGTIRSLAREFVAADGVAPVMYSGLEYSDGATQAIRATIVLWALAGQLDVPGGNCFNMRENQFPMNRRGHVPNPDIRKAAGHNNFPVYTAYRGEFHANILPGAVLEHKPYPIRLLLSLGASMIASWPQSEIWRKTLGGLDFLVCIDRQLTEDAAYADIVLPAATYYEIESYMRYGPLFRIRERVIEPVGEARSDIFIFAELAERLGYGHLYPQNEDELLAHALNGSGFTPDEVRDSGGMVQLPTVMMEYKKWEKGLLRPDGQPGFDTPSGKFEIASSILEEHGYDSLPVYSEPGEGPQAQPGIAERYPLVFNSGARSNVDIHTLHLSTKSLSEEQPVPTVMINTGDAQARDIDNGDYVRIETKRGGVNMYAYVTDDIVEGSVEASAMGGGPRGPEAWRNACVNDLTDLERYDPISGFPVYKALLCEVRKVRDGDSEVVSPGAQYELDDSVRETPSSERSYFDHNATSPMAEDVKKVMVEFMDFYGNPSSIYGTGKEAKTAIERARRSVALLIGATARRVTFTGGGSESNNLAIKGVAYSRSNGKDHIITSSIEHPSVLNTCRWLEKNGFTVTYLPVDGQGRVDPGELEDRITERTSLVSIMVANNETGTIQPIRELSAIARNRGVLFHTDAVQAVGKIPVDVENLDVDLLTMSGHKFHGPKGVGVLYVRKGVELEPLVSGGHQERGLRAGTENTLGIIGLGKAADLALDALSDMDRVEHLRDELEDRIRSLIPDVRLNGHPGKRLPNTLNLTLPDVRGESMVLALDQRGFAVSSGSACRSGQPDPSYALLAMGLSEEDAHCSLRFSLGRGNTSEEIDGLARAIEEVLRSSGDTIRFVSCR